MRPAYTFSMRSLTPPEGITLDGSLSRLRVTLAVQPRRGQVSRGWTWTLGLLLLFSALLTVVSVVAARAATFAGMSGALLAMVAVAGLLGSLVFGAVLLLSRFLPEETSRLPATWLELERHRLRHPGGEILLDDIRSVSFNGRAVLLACATRPAPLLLLEERPEAQLRFIADLLDDARRQRSAGSVDARDARSALEEIRGRPS